MPNALRFALSFTFSLRALGTRARVLGIRFSNSTHLLRFRVVYSDFVDFFYSLCLLCPLFASLNVIVEFVAVSSLDLHEPVIVTVLGNDKFFSIESYLTSILFIFSNFL